MLCRHETSKSDSSWGLEGWGSECYSSPPPQRLFTGRCARRIVEQAFCCISLNKNQQEWFSRTKVNIVRVSTHSCGYRPRKNCSYLSLPCSFGSFVRFVCSVRSFGSFVRSVCLVRLFVRFGCFVLDYCSSTIAHRLLLINYCSSSVPFQPVELTSGPCILHWPGTSIHNQWSWPQVHSRLHWSRARSVLDYCSSTIAHVAEKSYASSSLVPQGEIFQSIEDY